MLTPVLLILLLLVLIALAFLFMRQRKLTVAYETLSQEHNSLTAIEEIAEAVRKNHGEIDMTLTAEAIEYRKTLALLQTSGDTSATEPLPQAVVKESAILDV